MKKIFFAFFSLLAFTLAAQTTVADRPVAVVKLHKTEVIPQSKFEQYINVMEAQYGDIEFTAEDKRGILDVMINQLLVNQDAENKNIVLEDQQVKMAAMQQLSMELQQMGAIPSGAFLTDEAQFSQILAQQGMNADLYLENTRNNMMIQQYIMQVYQSDFQSIQKPTDREIQNFYNGNISLFAIPEYVKMRQIFFDSTETSDIEGLRAEAKALMNRIESGQISFDTALVTEGDLFPSLQNRTQPLFVANGDEETVNIFGDDFAMALFEDHTMGRPYYFESTVGFHIIVFDERKEAGIRTLSDPVSPMETTTVKDAITQMIYAEKQKALYAQLQQTLVIDLRDRAGEDGIRVYEEAIR